MTCRRAGDGGLPLDLGVGHRHRLRAGDEARRHRRIDADVAQRAPADGGVVADVPGVAVQEAERPLHLAQAADRPALHEVAGAQPLGMVGDHEGLGGELARPVARRDEGVDLRGAQRDRLLGQHVLAGLERLQRPFDVGVVGQRVVDRVDLRIGEQRLVAVGDPRPVARREAVRLARRAAGDGGDEAAVARLDAGADPLARDLRRPEDAPPHLLHVPSLP